MPLSLTAPVFELPEMIETLGRLRSGDMPVAIGGLSLVHCAHFAAALHDKTNRPVVVVCPDELDAMRVSADIEALTLADSLYLRDRSITLLPADTASREWEHMRLPVLLRMASSTAPILSASASALTANTLPPEALLGETLTLKPSLVISPDALTQKLVALGYTRFDVVEGVGQFARRGGIIDFFSPGCNEPVRVEFFGDEIDTLSYIDTSSQRRTEPVSSAVLLPCAETAEAAAESVPAFTYLPKNALIIVFEHQRIEEQLKNLVKHRAEELELLLEKGIITPENAVIGGDSFSLWNTLSGHDTIFIGTFLQSSYPLRPHALLNIAAKQLPSFGNSIQTALSDINHYLDAKTMLCIFSQNERAARQLEEILREHGVTISPDKLIPGAVCLLTGALSAGFEYPAVNLAVLTHGREGAKKERKKHTNVPQSNRRRIVSYTDLTPGDLVVHEHHGIGRFAGIVPIVVDDLRRDFIKILYAGTDCLYVPVTQLHLVNKYIGQSADSDSSKDIKLHKLGGTEWQKTKTRAKEAAKILAQSLIALYAERKRRPGFAFLPDSDWQFSFEEAFEYEETDDQLRCVEDIKRDMETASPMDRLLCGDVGFGKTEVALRAVMKCVLSGKQAALLVPTTVLAQQHFLTASRRFASYPVRIASLSRFSSPAQSKDILKRLRTGELDMVIGTHRLLQKDIKFKSLGLLIIDEEQRFGVGHKERLKEMSKQIDVLTLTATPIPRTLNMALSGIRDMSVIEEAPRDRYPVQTFVLEHDYSFLCDAIRREVGRGGQVYYLHNRVESITKTAARLTELLGGVTVDIAHGRMDESELSEAMRAFSEGDTQVLVCTTIIETGIDIPNVNTLIVEDADKLGLAQLHQIRGRVGRSNRHAYAYLTYKRGKVLSEIASKRLSAIREFAEFGSGFKIAMRDMEIRGAGNVLGAEQSGHMVNVGYDMYLKLLEEAVLEQQAGEDGAKALSPVDCTADLPVDAGISEKYISHSGIRMDYYRRIAAIFTEEDAEDMRDELIDRFGALPNQVNTLIRIARMRADAAASGITEVAQKGSRLNLTLSSQDFARISALCANPDYRGRILYSPGDKPYISIKIPSGADVIDMTVKAAKDLIGG